jgi:hypothetical protein
MYIVVVMNPGMMRDITPEMVSKIVTLWEKNVSQLFVGADVKSYVSYTHSAYNIVPNSPQPLEVIVYGKPDDVTNIHEVENVCRTIGERAIQSVRGW